MVQSSQAAFLVRVVLQLTARMARDLLNKATTGNQLRTAGRTLFYIAAGHVELTLQCTTVVAWNGTPVVGFLPVPYSIELQSHLGQLLGLPNSLWPIRGYSLA